MKTIATLGPSVRLVVFQFLMKSTIVPSIIPPKRTSNTPPLPPVSGIQVLESTPKVDLFDLASKLDFRGEYELVDVWKKPQHEGDWKMLFVRFVFCHRKHLKPNELFPEFVAKKAELENIFTDMTSKNLWATMGHLNPYFEDNRPRSQHVLMFGCAGRIPNTEVFQGGRDENNRGIGPKVLLSTLSHQLNLTGNEVILMAPELTATTFPVA